MSKPGLERASMHVCVQQPGRQERQRLPGDGASAGRDETERVDEGSRARSAVVRRPWPFYAASDEAGLWAPAASGASAPSLSRDRIATPPDWRALSPAVANGAGPPPP